MPNTKKTGEVILDGEKIKIKEGGLRSQLKVPKNHKFTNKHTFK